MKKFIGLYTLILLFLACAQSNVSDTKKDVNGPNDLINETSPYLLQHAYNPVDWRAWNNESLKLAKEENKLIVISIGYSACHWCHVMEEESFENDSVAQIMNENFINVKVDREERPDVDQVYMDAVQLMTGSGGWPLNCITLPDGRPVFGGTYFTKVQWTKIIKDMSTLYKNNPEKVIAYAEKLTEGINNVNLINVKQEKTLFSKEVINDISVDLKKSLDFEYGGLIGEPKFPMPSNLNFLLRSSFQNSDQVLEDYVITSLLKMSHGGIYDQIGGGFSRYSVDSKWHVPHFEKMLYDNAQLVSLYSKAYQLTKNDDFKTVITETLNFVETELMNNEGGFYSALDADSENAIGESEEGAYYVWTKEEIENTIVDDLDLFKSYYNINRIGLWEEEKYILYKTNTDKEFSKANNIDELDLQKKILNWKKLLYEQRLSRERPRTDDKILTSWNAIMLKAYIDAYKATSNEQYLKTALNNANFLKNNQINQDGSLFHNYKNGKSTINGFSEDYAHTIKAFIALYQVTYNELWLNKAKVLMDYTITHFLNEEMSMFYFTSDNSPSLIARKMEIVDNVIPSSNSVLAHNLFKLGHYYADKTYSSLAQQMLSNVTLNFEGSSGAYTNWLNLYLNYSNPYYEVAISGIKVNEKLKELNTSYIPNILIAASKESSDIPLLLNKFINDETFIYVCTNGSCKMPVNRVEQAKKQILK